MEQRQFEQAVLHLVYAGGLTRLTPAAVAYQLGLAVKDAERRLDQMIADGSLELDSDDDGNLFYFVPGAPAASPGGPQGPQPTAGALWPGSPGPGAPGAWPPAAPGHQPPGPQPPPGPAAWPGHAPPPHGAGWSPQPQSPPWQGAAGVAPSPGMGGQGYGNSPPTAWSGPQGTWRPPGAAPPTAMVPYRGGVPMPYAEDPPRSPSTAALLSFFPGAGQLYNGQIGKALAFFFSTMLLYSVFAPAGLATHIWAVVDAHSTSRRSSPQGLLPP